MIYCVLFEDDPERADMRAKHMQEHLAFLRRHADAIEAAGPLSDGDSTQPAGGMWLVTAEDTDAVRALVEADPFWPTGLRRSVRILKWTQVYSRR